MFFPSPIAFPWYESPVIFMVKLTRGLLLPVRAAWRCNRISTRRFETGPTSPVFVLVEDRTSDLRLRTSGKTFVEARSTVPTW